MRLEQHAALGANGDASAAGARKGTTRHAVRIADRWVGRSTMEEIERSVLSAGTEDLLIAHSNATYPCPPEILNLHVIRTLRTRYPYCAIGYSGHEPGYASTLAAVALGATFVERHVSLDRNMWGSDQQASLEPAALAELVRAIREVEAALGDGIKRRYASELPALRKLRRAQGAPNLID
jgi:N-acetylneuraminate synthase